VSRLAEKIGCYTGAFLYSNLGKKHSTHAQSIGLPDGSKEGIAKTVADKG